MVRQIALLSCGLLAVYVLAGCATSSVPPAEALNAAVQPAWSLDAADDDMIVAVSPARQTLQIAGSTGLLLGTGISAVVDDKYRRPAWRKRSANMTSWRSSRDRLTARLGAALGGDLEKVSPMGSAAGYHNIREAEKARYAGLAKSGCDVVLDLDVTFGIFGCEGMLITKVEGKLTETATGHALWRATYVVSSDPILAGRETGGPDRPHRAQSVESAAVRRGRRGRAVAGRLTARCCASATRRRWTACSRCF